MCCWKRVWGNLTNALSVVSHIDPFQAPPGSPDKEDGESVCTWGLRCDGAPGSLLSPQDLRNSLGDKMRGKHGKEQKAEVHAVSGGRVCVSLLGPTLGSHVASRTYSSDSTGDSHSQGRHVGWGNSSQSLCRKHLTCLLWTA